MYYVYIWGGGLSAKYVYLYENLEFERTTAPPQVFLFISRISSASSKLISTSNNQHTLLVWKCIRYLTISMNILSTLMYVFDWIGNRDISIQKLSKYVSQLLHLLSRCTIYIYSDYIIDLKHF